MSEIIESNKKIIDGWNKKPVHQLTMSPGSRAWIHRFGLESYLYGEERLNGHIPDFSYSYTVNTSCPITKIN